MEIEIHTNQKLDDNERTVVALVTLQRIAITMFNEKPEVVENKADRDEMLADIFDTMTDKVNAFFEMNMREMVVATDSVGVTVNDVVNNLVNIERMIDSHQGVQRPN